MFKIRKYIIVVLGLLLFLVTYAVANAHEVAMLHLNEHNTVMHNPESSADCIISHDEIAEEEQINQVSPVVFFNGEAVFIAQRQNPKLFFQSLFIPLKPPRFS